MSRLRRTLAVLAIGGFFTFGLAGTSYAGDGCHQDGDPDWAYCQPA
ncbi:hypothetical protein [Streptomyces sp. NPDC089919]